jgi:hypothetical protein
MTAKGRRDEHDAAIATLTGATSTVELAAALRGFTRLDKPGFPNDLPDGRYFDGFFFATIADGQPAVTQIHALPVHTMELWSQLDEEQRDQDEQDLLIDDVHAERRGPGQPPIGRPVPVRLPSWRIAQLDRDAEDAGVDRAKLIRALIAVAYAQLDRDARAAGTDRGEQIRALMRERTAGGAAARTNR